jgi:hypothetical protein
MTEWTTREGPALHIAWFKLKEGRAGRGSVNIQLDIPECAMCFGVRGDDGEVLYLDICRSIRSEPADDYDVNAWVHYACEKARQDGVSVDFSCHTHEEAERVAGLATRLLPDHERVTLKTGRPLGVEA